MPRPIAGGGMPRPIPGGGIIPDAPGGGAIIPGPPTPWTGPAPNPIAGPPPPPIGGAAVPRPAPRAIPGPPGVSFPEILGGGGPSTAKLTTFSPRIKTNPKFRFSVFSSTTAPLLRNVLNSSASDRTKFICLSKAKKVPKIVLPSPNVTRSLCSTYLNNLLPFPDGFESINQL